MHIEKIEARTRAEAVNKAIHRVKHEYRRVTANRMRNSRNLWKVTFT